MPTRGTKEFSTNATAHPMMTGDAAAGNVFGRAARIQACFFVIEACKFSDFKFIPPLRV